MLSRVGAAIKKNLTSYDLFAIAVVNMVASHFFFLFMREDMWLRIPDRITVLIFLLTIGYNSSRKTDLGLWAGAAITSTAYHVALGITWSTILGVIALLRLIIEPMMAFLLKSKERFIAFNIIFLILSPILNFWMEYGTMGIMLGMAGWINRNRDEVKGIVSPRNYYIFVIISYIIFTELIFPFNPVEFIIMALGCAFVGWLMYDFRALIMNSIVRRPKDRIEKLVSFIGHKGMEIYVVHLVLFLTIYYVFVSLPH